MNQLSRVLVAIDFSRASRDAFDFALELSRHHRAELIAIQAVPTNETFARHARARVTLRETLRISSERAGVEFSARIQTGAPAEIVLLHARSLRPDVIVVGTHQRRDLERLRSGSVAERIAAGATVPVVVVPRRRNATTPAAVRHVAVGVDFSAGSIRAIEQALMLAKDAADRISLIHVLPGSSSSAPRPVYRHALEEHEHPSIRDVRRRLHAAVPARPKSWAAIDTQVTRGDAATEIKQVVDDVGADLVIVGATARGFVSRALFGTTAARLLRVTCVPVLIVPDVSRSRDEEKEDDVQRLAA